MAIRTHAVLNPILATALPITISIPPRTNAPVEALRLSLLGVAAVHQACNAFDVSDADALSIFFIVLYALALRS